MKIQASIMPGIYERVRYSRKEGSKMIQDIAPHKLNNQYGQKKAPDAGSRFLYYDGRKVLVRKEIGGNENQIAYPTYEELKKAYEAAMQKCSELESQNAELESEKTREC